MDNLSMNVQYIKGVGPKRAKKLRKLGVSNIFDLLYYVPRDYEDRSRFVTLKETIIGEKSRLEIEGVGKSQIIKPRRNMSILKIPFRDSSGNGYLVWFNQDYLKYKFKIGDKYRVNGKINRMGTEMQVMNPAFENINQNNNVGKIVPIYDLTKGLTNNAIKKIIYNGLKEHLPKIDESLPIDIREKYELIGIKEAIKNIHMPQNLTKLQEARRRLVFEELLILQLGLITIKQKNLEENTGISFPNINEVGKFINNLPFELTSAQNRVFKEI